jgi:hypothetical protein
MLSLKASKPRYYRRGLEGLSMRMVFHDMSDREGLLTSLTLAMA